MLFAFDDNLIGYQEVVVLKTSDLDIPLFTFPKGSFFVDGTYAKVKGTNTILRPGIDYLVLSCNETIPFSTDATIDVKLKQAYVRNVILLRSLEEVELEWYVAYCGGEDSDKVAEYDNYINQLYNEARSKGTANLLTTPYQAWGGMLSTDNTQMVSGKHIYSHGFRVEEETEHGGGLGWGKVELAMEALSESVSKGNDNAVIEAFFNWVKHNEIEFNKKKFGVNQDLEAKISNLDGKRVAVDQFIFKEEDMTANPMNFVEHNNVMLRGINPNEPNDYIADPILTNRKDPGFYGLATQGYDINTNAVKLLQRIESPITRVRYGVVFEQKTNTSESIAFRLIKEPGAITTGTHTLYVVSKRLGIIHTANVTTALTNPLAINNRFILTYPVNRLEHSMDSLFAYILDNNMQGDFKWVGTTNVINNNLKHYFSLDVINRGNMIGDSQGEVINNVSTQFEVIVKRTYSLNPTRVQLRANLPATNTVINFNISDVFLNVDFAVGEEEKRIMVNMALTPELIAGNSSFMLYLGPDSTTIISSVLVGLKGTGKQDYAQISLLDFNGQIVNAIDLKNTYILQVQFSKDADYFIGDLVLSLTKLLGTTATASLGTKEIISNSLINYPISFSGTLDAVVSLGLNNTANIGFKTNRLNIAYGTNNVNAESPVFDPIVNGKHLRISRELDSYNLDFAIAVKDHNSGGYIFDLSSNNPDLVTPASVITNQGLLHFNASIAVNKLQTGTIRLNFVRAGQSYPLDFTINVDKLIAIEIEYRDGAYSDKALETGRPFRLMLTNPFTDRKLVITRDTFPIALGITDINYGGDLTEIVVATLTLEPGERKQLTVGDWVIIENIQSNAVQVNRYAPNCNVSQVLVANGNVAKTGSYLTEVGEISINKEGYKVQAVNVLTGNAIYDQGMVDNYIDVITQFDVDISTITNVDVVTTNGYIATVRNTVISPIDKTIIVALTVKRNDNSLMDASSINLNVSYLNASSQVVHKVTTSLTGI